MAPTNQKQQIVQRSYTESNMAQTNQQHHSQYTRLLFFHTVSNNSNNVRLTAKHSKKFYSLFNLEWEKWFSFLSKIIKLKWHKFAVSKWFYPSLRREM